MHVTTLENDEADRRISNRRASEAATHEHRYDRRRYDRRTKTFFYNRTIHLSDTNTFGSVYYSRFIDFQGEAREEFLQYFMGKDLLTFINEGYGIVTIEIRCKYKAPLFVFDDVTVNLQVPVIKRTKFKLSMITEKINGKQQAAVGEQWIGFTAPDGKVIPIPEIVLNNLKHYKANEN